MKVYIAIKETLIPYEGTETEILNVFAKYEDAKEVLQKQFEEDVKFRSHRGTIVEDTDSPINVYLEDYDEIHYSIVEKEVL
jgi:hypothetical protein